MMDQIEIIKLIKSQPAIDGYLLKVVQENGLGISLLAKTDKISSEIGVFISNNSYKQFSTFLTLLEVETIIQPLLKKHKIFDTVDGGLTYTLNFRTIESELFRQTLNPSYPKTIETEQDVIDLLNDLNNYTKNVAEPFFEKWSDLRVLDKFLETVPQMEVHNYLGGYGVYSKLLIYRLCNNPKYNEYMDLMYSFAINRFKENPNGDIAIKRKHGFMIDFKEVLDKTEPIYNV
ncbi:hypothetical protein [Pedobacter endophyticus]|uniref:Uncharacterized protein n=1 Tax=Pedobacter endophyticus TaxID=2789740 RepID=A0A7S9KZ09_9SPHI|nr:hypothetical protein [Pedobacter endophyticus]QPH39447.1 hypothetical protein IZT61_20785 [Pedobacter endophyticus]